MIRLLITALLFISHYTTIAAVDSLFIVSKNDKWMVEHTVRNGETIFMLARRYHVPPALLADENGMNYQSGLATGTVVYIPIGVFNKANATTPAGDMRPVYYKVREFDNLYRIGKNAGEQQRILQEWNGLPDNSVQQGQVLIVSKILYDGAGQETAVNTTTAKQNTTVATPAQNAKGQKYTIQYRENKVKQTDGSMVTYLEKDTVWADTLGMYGKTYMQQTGNEKYTTEEKGSAVFYQIPGKAQSRYPPEAKAILIYAFHNQARRGTIIKVYNPGTGKSVFVKVMGPLPETKLYYNSILGISADAKELLGVTEDKTWVELKYNSQ